MADVIKDVLMGKLFGTSGSSSGGGSSGGGGGWPSVDENDGATYLYISLAEGRTSPMVGVGVYGTVAVDWGDGTEPDVLTGTDNYTPQWTPNHDYSEPGDYVIRITHSGSVALRGLSTSNKYAYILRHTPDADVRNRTYQHVLRRLVAGDNVIISNYAFANCGNITSVVMPSGVGNIDTYAFNNCYGVVYYDFTSCTAVPTLSNTNAFSGIPADCEIRVPAALYDEWIAATNWATYADKIKAY